jgi:cellulose 1,4-beta-cellobiosidase
MLAVTALAFTAAPALAATHVTNPWYGANWFVNPDYQAEVDPYIALQTAAGNTTLAAAATKVRNQSTAIWLDSKASITGSGGRSSLTALLDAAVTQQTKKPAKPVVVTIVIYDLPQRDCNANASNGEFPAGAVGEYKSDYINPIATILSNSAYANLRFALIIEPDSLPNAVSNIGSKACTKEVAEGYEQGIVYALDAFHPITNAYNFLDISNASWLSWNTAGAATEYQKVVLATSAKYASIDGFVTNVSNYSPVQEPFYGNQKQVNGTAVNKATFYGGQRAIDELSFIKFNDPNSYIGLRAALQSVGFPTSSLNFAIDTSRNGWGGKARPTKASSSTDVNVFVDQSRIDRRLAPNDWCNQSGAGIGLAPWASSDYPTDPQLGALQYIDAFVWVKPPGESDGTSDPNASGYDKMCDPTQPDEFRPSVLTGALPNTPHAGTFNYSQFTQLLINASPSLGAVGGKPGKVRNLSGQPTDGGAAITWDAPASDGGNPITGYSVSYSVGGGSSGTSCQTMPNVTSCVYGGLSNGVQYTFQVWATTAAGDSVGVTVVVTPKAGQTVPGAPTNVTATANASQSATLSWTAPTNTGGSKITGYIVTDQDGKVGCTSTGPTSCLFNHSLVAGKTYYWKVQAVNSTGTGPAAQSNSIKATGAPATPAAPIAKAGNASATVTWTAPASNGYPITFYAVVSIPAASSCTTTGATTCTVTGLTNGTAYTFTVFAQNSSGPGSASPPSNSVTPVATATVPGAPTGVTATAGNAQATVTWVAPASNGGSAITSYRVTALPGGNTCVSGTLSCTVNLTNGTAYTFTVTATNAIGTGPASAASASVTPRTVPGAPTGVTATAGNASAAVVWVAPANNGGSTITGYTVTASPGGKTCTWTTGALTCTVSGLTNGTAYTFTVKATNAAGTGAASAASASVTPTAAGAVQCRAAVSTSSTWMSGTNGYGQVVVTVTNSGTVSTASWEVKLVWPHAMTINGTASNGNVTGSGTTNYTVTNVSYNGALAAGANTGSNSPNFQVYGSGAYAAPTSVSCSAK